MICQRKVKVGLCDNHAQVQIWGHWLGRSAHGSLLASADLEQTSPKPQHKGGPDAHGLVLGGFGSFWRREMYLVGPGGSRLPTVRAVVAKRGKLYLLAAVFRHCAALS